ncbi:acyltransferase family protein [Paraburkholderia antibiotica]|uniref:Acyltransferase n=1 Tax=Paraburkholderia antibiotica TaxID=2728839 RepID=A0A7Y0A150_9BURK|nr:acyltransferase [Paraburkholderia antibiotica]NML34596.1 acyltransferase [Paraburkholderia antibiotica]
MKSAHETNPWRGGETIDSASTAVASEVLEIQTTRTHIKFLDGMRGLAALYVCLTHSWNFPSGNGIALSRAHRILRFLLEGGHCAVSVFIVLSGYCLTLPYLNGKRLKAGEFFATRAMRILPPYYACLLICLLLNYTLLSGKATGFWVETSPIDTRAILLHVFMLHDWSAASASKIDYVLWSVGVEWKIYFLLPVLVLFGRRFGFMRTAAASVVASFAVWVLLYRHDWLNPGAFGSSVYYVGLFACGMAAAVYVDQCQQGRARFDFKWIGVAMACLTVIVLATEFKKVGPLQVASLFSGLLACFVIVWMSLRERSAMKSFLSTGPITGLGKISFSLYLIHPPLLQLSWTYLIEPNFPASRFLIPITFAISVAVSIAGAYLFFWAFEFPSLMWIRRTRAARSRRTMGFAVADRAESAR